MASMNSTFREITIDLSNEHENADDSIRINREFDSNEMVERELHRAKQDERKISTLRGIRIAPISGDDGASPCFLRDFQDDKSSTETILLALANIITHCHSFSKAKQSQACEFP
jgi:hypothetical protein